MSEIKKPTVRMRLDAWSYTDYQAFADAMRKMDLRTAFELADKIIESWSYPSPFVAGALKKLNVQEAMLVLRSVLDTLNHFAQEVDTNGVVVDMSKWSLDDFLKFNDFREAGNTRRLLSMVREVAIVEGLEDGDEPTMTQGVLMVKAVTDAIGAIITGKN